MSVTSFSGSLGVAQLDWDRELGTSDIRSLGLGAERQEQLSGYFAEWCGARGGRVETGSGLDEDWRKALAEYRTQRSHASFGDGRACGAKDGAGLGGYVLLGYSDDVLVAFYEPPAFNAFLAKFGAAATQRAA